MSYDDLVTYEDYDEDRYSYESLLKGITNHTLLNSYSSSHNRYEKYEKLTLDPRLFENVPTVEGYSIEVACNWIYNHSYNYYNKATCGWCARAVRLAIEAGFGNPNSTNGHPGWAWHYIYFLPKIGFELIGEVLRNYKFVTSGTTYTPIAGDIGVYQKNGNSSEPGHICMYTGQQWCADFKQSGLFVYSQTPSAYIFRIKT